ncbi:MULTISPECIES: AAA family ATPase [unclassified Microbacterium]|uniref:AAA family ATPase n=1 Tax=unclassified Microbacterium TaxID=2609290 RepID=UPI00288348CF|nr:MULTISPECIES: AAA family ATPase [unclassified Microbacterium]
MTSTYIETGGQVRVYDNAVRAHESFPLGTYRVQFSSKEGFSLIQVEDLSVGDERVYGGRDKKVDKIFRSYGLSDRSLGVMLSGDKGIGKSLFLRMVAQKARDNNLPVVIVTEDNDGIVDFLDSLDECLIVFDEFEKTFPAGRRGLSDGINRQNQFLSLFDGLSSVKRIYCLTVNDVADVSTYIVNRPGRFHYHMRFDYPGPDEVRQYLADQAPDAHPDEVENVALFSRRARLNYDHLRAIAFELQQPDALFAEIVEDLNIKSVDPSTYKVEARFPDGKIWADEIEINLFERGDVGHTYELKNSNRSIFVSFRATDLVFEKDGGIHAPIEKIHLLDDYDDEPEVYPMSLSLTLVGQATYGFGL